MDSYSIKYLTSLKNEPARLFEELLEIWRKELKNKEKKTPQIIIELNKKYGIDFCKLGLKAINEGVNCLDVFYILEDALPYLTLDVSNTMAFLQKTHKCIENLASSIQYAPIKKLANTQPDFTRSLLKELLKLKDAFIIGYISAIFEEFSKNNLVEIHTELVSMTETNLESEYLLQAIIISLGNLDYQSNINNFLLIEKTLEVFDKLLKKSNTNIKVTIVIALGALSKFTDDVFKRLFKLACIEQPQIKFQISTVLLYYFNNAYNNQWVAKILIQLSNTKCEYKGIINNLNFILLKIIREKKNYTLTEDFFTKWVLGSDYGNTRYKLEDLFNSLLTEFVNNEEFFSKLITKYFNHENSKLHLAGSELVQYCHFYKKHQLKLNSDILNHLSFNDLKHICRKILGYLYEPITLCSLIFSIYESNPENKDIQNLIFSIFIEILGKDYSETIFKFLEEKLTEYNKLENIKNFINSIIETIKKQQDQLNSLTRLKEFLMPRKFAYQISLENNKMMIRIMEETQENSIVSLITTKIPLKYGRKWFGYVNEKYSTPSKLTSFSHVVKLPRSEMTHPVSAALRRFEFRLSKRGKS